MEKEGRDYRSAHVLILPYPAQGHLNPLIQFAKRLVISKGLKATLAPTIFLTKTMEIEPGPIGVEPISDGCDEAGYAEAGSVEVYLERLESVGSRTLGELINKMAQSGHPVTCLVYDAFFPWALGVAKRMGLTGACFFTQTCCVSAIYYHVYHGNLLIPPDVTTITLPALPELGVPDLPSFFSEVGSYPAYMKLVLNQFSNLESADWIIFNTIYKLEEQIVKWMEERFRIITIGPTLPSKYLDKRLEGDENYSINLYKTENAGAYIKWLDLKPTGSVVYVSFGSISALSEEYMEELAWGLRGSNKYFLWVVRGIENNKNQLLANFIEGMEDKGLLVSWSKQMEVLAHRAVGCFVTHCGWNSTMEALCLGVPMVCAPLWTDQPTNAKLVEDVWGVGVRAKVDEKGVVRREEMESCIREVMDGEKSKEIKRNAQKWKDLVKEAMDEGGSSDKNIEEFVANLVKT